MRRTRWAQLTMNCVLSAGSPAVVFSTSSACRAAGVYVDRGAKLDRFTWVKAPGTAELSQLTHTIAHRIGRYLERQGVLVPRGHKSGIPSRAIWLWTSLKKTR
jgi:hypothetical protein